MPPVPGAYPLTAVGKLPNATVISPGEVWSNQRANGIIIPGAAIGTRSAVMPACLATSRFVRTSTMP